MHTNTKKQLHIHRYEITMLAIVAGATLLRLILLLSHWPAPNSDESIMDLIAYHIIHNGEHSTFYYGQNYMAPIEAYIGAALFPIFGISTLTVRLGLLPFYTIFLVCMYYLTSLLYTRGLALLTIALLSLGSSGIFLHQLLAIGGYPEVLCFASAIFLLAVWLARTAPTSKGAHLTAALYWRRLLLYFLLGAIIGLAIWDDQLIAPFVLAAGLMLLLFCWRDLLGWASLCLLIGCILGALPLIIYNIYYAAPGQNSWDTLLYLHHVGSDLVAAAHISTMQQLLGVLLFSIPIATGFNPCNRTADLPLYQPANRHTLACITAQGTWSAAFIVLWLIALVLVAWNIWSIYRRWAGHPQDANANEQTRWTGHAQGECPYNDDETPSDEPSRAIVGAFPLRVPLHELISSRELHQQLARFLLLITTAIAFLLFVTSNAAALYPVSSARYLILFLVATPAILWPLWKPISTAQLQLRQSARPLGRLATQLLCIAMLLFVAATYVFGTLETFVDIPTAQAAFTTQQALTRDMLRIGATRFYSDYWSCIGLIFESREQLICASLNPQLGQGYDRYKPYRYAVRQTPHPAYLFALDSPLLQVFLAKHKNDSHYQRHEFAGYVVYTYNMP